MLRRTILLTILVGLLLGAAATAQAAPTNRELAKHYATANAVAWAFDQHRFALYGDTRRPLGYRFDGCHRAAPGRFICRVAIGYGYGDTVIKHTANVRVNFVHGHVTVSRALRSDVVSLGVAAELTQAL